MMINKYKLNYKDMSDKFDFKAVTNILNSVFDRSSNDKNEDLVQRISDIINDVTDIISNKNVEPVVTSETSKDGSCTVTRVMFVDKDGNVIENTDMQPEESKTETEETTVSASPRNDGSLTDLLKNRYAEQQRKEDVLKRTLEKIAEYENVVVDTIKEVITAGNDYTFVNNHCIHMELDFGGDGIDLFRSVCYCNELGENVAKKLGFMSVLITHKSDNILTCTKPDEYKVTVDVVIDFE